MPRRRRTGREEGVSDEPDLEAVSWVGIASFFGDPSGSTASDQPRNPGVPNAPPKLQDPCMVLGRLGRKMTLYTGNPFLLRRSSCGFGAKMDRPMLSEGG